LLFINQYNHPLPNTPYNKKNIKLFHRHKNLICEMISASKQLNLYLPKKGKATTTYVVDVVNLQASATAYR
jgi:hypothetical protein